MLLAKSAPLHYEMASTCLEGVEVGVSHHSMCVYFQVAFVFWAESAMGEAHSDYPFGMVSQEHPVSTQGRNCSFSGGAGQGKA